MTKEVEIHCPWGGHFQHELEIFMKEIGLYTENPDTGSDDYAMAYSREPLEVEQEGHYEFIVVSPTEAKIYWFTTDWKHLFLGDKDHSDLREVGIGVELTEKDDRTYIAKFTKLEG